MADVLAFRHVAFEDLGLLEPLLRERGHAVRYIDVPLAELGALDVTNAGLLVVLGGPISVYDEHSYPFLTSEIALIERRLSANRPTLGLCLGAQMMARALGARVYAAPAKEIGWAPVTLGERGRTSALAKLEDAPVLHWHGDTFDLPTGSTLLASTELCRHQAFSYAGNALALQFHAEVTAQKMEAWFVGHAAEIAATPGLSVPGLRDETHRWAPLLERNGHAMFEIWLESVGL
jgi:GMP synthase (glutamine-hydrolysing)